MTVSTRCRTIDVRLDCDVSPFSASLTCDADTTEGVYFVRLSVACDHAAPLPDLRLAWDLPSVDFHHKWNPRCMQNRALDIAVGSYNFTNSSANSGMPVYCLYDLAGTNACTWALDDVVHDTRTGGTYTHGGEYRCEAVVLGAGVGCTNGYEVSIRFDFRRVPYYEALHGVDAFWRRLLGGAPRPIPDAAFLPVLSSWYIYTVDIDPDDFERECALAAEMGFGVAILDDGWQTESRTPGYGGTGDWEVCTAKLPDFRAHVRRVQALGLRYLVWFSVPFVGVRSKAAQRFANVLLPARKPNVDHRRLDPRYPQVREYLADTYERFVQRYGVDGLKLDFIDSFSDDVPSGDADDDRRDFVSIGEAVCALLDEVDARLARACPNALVEFRQAYTGPAMRRHATMFRAVDCPNSIGDNRVRTLDLRLLAGDSPGERTPVHSDPITWNDDEPVHSAAMQLVHALFSVPQVSRRISNLPELHRKMLRRQIAFFHEHRDVLQHGDLRPLAPHVLYPLVIARNSRKLLAACYADVPVRPNDGPIPETLIVVNGSYVCEIVLDLSRDIGLAELSVEDCCGDVVDGRTSEFRAGLHRLSIPPAGHARIRRLSDPLST